MCYVIHVTDSSSIINRQNPIEILAINMPKNENKKDHHANALFSCIIIMMSQKINLERAKNNLKGVLCSAIILD